MKKYDLIVIGSGGGSRVCVPVAQLGYKVAVIEKGKMGGTCLNRGCIPSKMMIHPSNVAREILEAKKFSITAGIRKIDFAKLVARINKSIDKESNEIKASYKGSKNPVLYPYEAKFVADKVLEVNGEKITADKIIIAAGARTMIPPIPGLKGTPFMTSSEALRNKKIPKNLIVIGGGYIAVELGNAYGFLGSTTHFLVRDNFIGREDVDVINEFTKVAKKTHKVYMPVETEKVGYKNKIFSVTIKDKKGKRKIVKGDGLLVATGVMANSDLLSLQNTKITTDKRGFISTDDYCETTVKGVYAIGDVAGKYLFRHSVNFEGEFLQRTLFKEKKKQKIQYPPMPHAIFTYPEIGSVGATEQELIEKKIPYAKGMSPYIKSAMGEARLSDHGFVKLLFDKKTKKLLGAHIVGDEASTMIHQLIYAMTFNATLDDLLKMIYIHPALPEIVRNACRDARRQF